MSIEGTLIVASAPDRAHRCRRRHRDVPHRRPRPCDRLVVRTTTDDTEGRTDHGGPPGRAVYVEPDQQLVDRPSDAEAA